MLSVIKCWCLFLAFLLFMNGKAVAGEVGSVSPLHLVALLSMMFREHQDLVGVSEKMSWSTDKGCVLEVSGQALPETVAKADQAGVLCTFNVHGSIALRETLDLKGHRLIGQPSWEFPHDHPQLLPVRKYERTSVKQRGLDILEQAVIVPELDHSFPSYQNTKPLITPSAEFSGDVLVRLWPGAVIEKLAIDERRVPGGGQVNPSGPVRIALVDIDWVAGGLSQQKTDGKQCGGGSGGGQGGCLGKPSRSRKGQRSTVGLASGGLNRSGSSSAGAGGEDPSDPAWNKEEPADAGESLENGKKKKEKKEKNKNKVKKVRKKKGHQKEAERGNIGSPQLDEKSKKTIAEKFPDLDISKSNDTTHDEKSNDIPEAEVDLDDDLHNFNPDLGKSGMNLFIPDFEFGEVSETGSLNIANEEPGDNSGQQATSLNNILGDEGSVAGDPVPEPVNGSIENDDDDIIFPGESNNADDDFSGSVDVDEDQRALSPPPPPPPCGKETGTAERKRTPSPECVDV